MIISVCLNPTIQKTLSFASFKTGAVNRASARRWDASGKGMDVSRVLVQLGAEAVHLTQLGGRFRSWFLDMAEKDSVSIRWTESGSEVRFCYTVLDRAGNCTTELVEEGETVLPETEAGILREFTSLCAEAGKRSDAETAANQGSAGARFAGAVVISGSRAGGFSDHVFPDMLFEAAKHSLLTVADFRGPDLLASLKSCPSVIKPNCDEFMQTFFPGHNLVPEDCGPIPSFISDKMRGLFDTWGCKTVITRGKEAVWAYDGANIHTLPVNAAVKAVNTTGSGDAFTAGFTYALTQGAFFSAALEEGCRCGALNAASVRPGDIRGI